MSEKCKKKTTFSEVFSFKNILGQMYESSMARVDHSILS